jgi:hypothetical protein
MGGETEQFPEIPVGPADGISGWGPSAWAAASAQAQPPFASRPELASAAPSPAARPSMADTLRDTFGLNGPDSQASAPGFVHAAYGNLRSLGL